MKRIAALALLCSCSWTFSRPPDPPRRTAHGLVELCKPSYAPPTLDTINAVGAGLFGLALLSDGSNEDMGAMGGLVPLMGVMLLAEGALYAASAHYGFKQARRCKEQRADFERGAHWMTPSTPVIEVPTSEPIIHEEEVEENEVIHRNTRIRSRMIVHPSE